VPGMPQRKASGRAETAHAPAGSRLGKPENQAPRIQVNELVTDRRGGNTPGKGRERQDADLSENLRDQIVSAGVSAGRPGDMALKDAVNCASYQALGLYRRIRVSLRHTASDGCRPRCRPTRRPHRCMTS